MGCLGKSVGSVGASVGYFRGESKEAGTHSVGSAVKRKGISIIGYLIKSYRESKLD